MHDPLYHPDPRLRVAANLADAPLHLIEAMIIRLEIYASSNKPRGSVQGFPIAAVAAHWDWPAEGLERVYAALKRVGWINQAELVAPPKVHIRDLVPTSGPLPTRRGVPTPARLCEDVTGELMGDPAPGRSALAAAKARA